MGLSILHIKLLLSYKVYLSPKIKTFVIYISICLNATLRNMLARKYTLNKYMVYTVSIIFIHNVIVYTSGMHR